ncbi:MAG: prolyl oligopeptidase family serine peptidase [Proteobacteria bacterium]|nr:prolyl oligopeptidase family serine peptidase [Pseudomonadota bacterium]
MRRSAPTLAVVFFCAALALFCTSCSGTGAAPGVDNPAPVEPTQAERGPTRAPAIAYPDVRRGEVIDDYHGVKVADPYRWLENADSDEVKAWIAAQNHITFGFLDRIPARESIRKRLTELWDHEKYGIPLHRGGGYFFTKNDGLQNQSALYWTHSLSAEPSVLLDPNQLSQDGTVSLAGFEVSDDGKYLAYGLQSGGSDWQEWRVREIVTGKDLNDHIKWIKFSGVSWTPDGKGFYYSRYPEPKKGDDLTGTNYFQKLYYHRIGTEQSQDVLVYERPDKKKWGFTGRVSDDGKYLIISVWKGTGNKFQIYYQTLGGDRAAGPGMTKKATTTAIRGLITTFEADFRFIDNIGPVFWFFTDLDAPRGRIIAIDTRKPERKHWKEVIAQSEHTLRQASMVGDRLFAHYVADAHSQVAIFGPNGERVGEVNLPGIGSVRGFDGRRSDRETFYAFTGFTSPKTIFRYRVESKKSEVFRRPNVDFDGSRYQTRQIFYHSKDGTRIPMFVVHKKGLARDGDNPTYLHGYGGFNVSLTPYFSVVRSVWLEMGGILAIANLRGGGEYGEKWHQSGTKLNKQNTFDDFIAAAEWLINNKYTSSKKLAIVGGSNGGLLVGAVMAQRPELFGAALPAVGVMDMLRFHKFTIGWAWMDDYGSPDNPDEFKALYAYSPYHNLKPNTSYPATLATTADHDDRVVPAHSFKFISALQHAHKGEAPVLIRVETRAGHGRGKPTSMRIAEAADKLAFMVKTLGVQIAKHKDKM